MTISEKIRERFRAGAPVVEIARELGIRYQHVYKVCRDTRLFDLPERQETLSPPAPPPRPRLTVQALREGGFVDAGSWTARESRISCPSGMPGSSGVYAFSIDEEVVYVGLASKSLAQRLYHYGNPGKSQRTNIRLNALIRDSLTSDRNVQIHYACPPGFEWNGFRISGSEGLEAGLIATYYLPWNVRGT